MIIPNKPYIFSNQTLICVTSWTICLQIEDRKSIKTKTLTELKAKKRKTNHQEEEMWWSSLRRSKRVKETRKVWAASACADFNTLLQLMLWREMVLKQESKRKHVNCCWINNKTIPYLNCSCPSTWFLSSYNLGIESESIQIHVKQTQTQFYPGPPKPTLFLIYFFYFMLIIISTFIHFNYSN